MSEASSALPGAVFEGFASVQEAGLCGMITLRGDLGHTKLRGAVKKLCGVDVPGSGQIATKGNCSAAWMSPDELLLIVPYEDAAGGVAALRKALKGSHFLAENLSDARALFEITGEGAREVLAKLTPADLSVRGLPIGQMRRSRLAQVPAAFWVQGDGTISVICFRSVATYVFGLLCHSAAPGSAVGYL